MDGELSLEQLSAKLDDISKVANKMQSAMDEKDKDHKAQEEEKDKKAKKAQDEKMEEEKKEARGARYKAMKKAMDEPDEEKRDAAIKLAMEEHPDKEHEGMDNNNMNHEKDAMTDEEKEEHASVASIINDKKAEFIEKILTANKIFNPTNFKEIEARVKKANLTELKKEWSTVEPFIAAQNIGAAPTEQQSPPVIPYFASLASPDDVDASQLNANSPASSFAKLTTKQIMELGN